MDIYKMLCSIRLGVQVQVWRMYAIIHHTITIVILWCMIACMCGMYYESSSDEPLSARRRACGRLLHLHLVHNMLHVQLLDDGSRIPQLGKNFVRLLAHCAHTQRLGHCICARHAGRRHRYWDLHLHSRSTSITSPS